MLYRGTECASPLDTLQPGRSQKAEGASSTASHPARTDGADWLQSSLQQRATGGLFALFLLNRMLEKLSAMLEKLIAIL